MSRRMTRVGDLVGHALPSRDGERLVKLIRAWPSIVGEAIAREAWPARITSTDTLVVHVTSAVWASELTHMAEDVQAKLAQTMLTETPGSVVFRVGTVPQPAVSVKVGLPAEPSQHDHDRAARASQGISDPTVRHAAATALASALARRAREP